MVNPSTLRQGRYNPLHGSWWSKVLGGRIAARNPFIELEQVADKKQHAILHATLCLLCMSVASALARGWSTGGLQMPKGRCSRVVASRKRLGTKMSPAMCSAGRASPPWSPHGLGHSIGMHRFGMPGRDAHAGL